MCLWDVNGPMDEGGTSSSSVVMTAVSQTMSVLLQQFICRLLVRTKGFCYR